MRYIDISTTKVWSILSIYIYRLIICLFVKYAIQNDTGLLLVIVLHQVDKIVRYRAYITQYSYYCYFFRSSIDYIAYLPTLRGEHCVFVVTIKTYKCDILKLVLLRFDLSHRYLYALLIFLFVVYAIQKNTG